MSNVSSKIILASGSPRRLQLMEAMGFSPEVLPAEVEEVFPDDLDKRRVPEFLAELKAGWVRNQKGNDRIIVAADTIVLLEDEILGKPRDEQQAFDMLQSLSGRSHEVITGVCIMKKEKKWLFSSVTKVYFRPLTADQIQYYIKEFRPMDKAGSYAIQEWIGMIGIEKIEGDYYNVMGLPAYKVYEYLQNN